MRKISTIFPVIIIVIPALVLFSAPVTEASEIEDNTLIEGDDELIYSGLLSGGSGTLVDPYVISGHTFNTSGLYLKDISYHLRLDNLTFKGERNTYELNLYNVSSSSVKNTTFRGRDHLLRIRDSGNILLYNISVFDIPSVYSYVYMSDVYPVMVDTHGDIVMEECLFHARANGSSSGSLPVLIKAGRFIDENSFFNGVGSYVYCYDGNLWVRNSTFGNNSVLSTDGQSKTYIIGNCQFENSSLYVGPDVGEARIQKNNFRGNGSRLRLYGSWKSKGEVSNNTFEKSGGIMGGTYQNRMYGWEIHHNYFGNCSNGAFVWDPARGDDVTIWRNIFFQNRRTDDNFSVPQVDVEREPAYGYEDINWSSKGVGNYWSDWTGPETDKNGIVDKPYMIQFMPPIYGYPNITDPNPVSNMFFDTNRPWIKVFGIPGDVYNMDYLFLNWTAKDIGTGVEQILLSTDNETWIDVRGNDSWAVELNKGTNTICVRVRDRAGLTNISFFDVEVDDIQGPLRITDPLDGDHLQKEDLTIRWSLDRVMDPVKGEIIVDGEATALTPGKRSHDISLEEGHHRVTVRYTDRFNVTIERRISFTIDTTKPIIEIIAPSEGVDLTNPLVRCRWNIYDNYVLSSTEYSFDDGDIISTGNSSEVSADLFLEDGLHHLEVSAVDRAGWRTTESIRFTVGNGSSLNFRDKTPLHFTSNESMRLTWDLDTSFVESLSMLENMDSGDQFNVTGLTEFDIGLPLEGRNRMRLSVRDPYGNAVRTATDIIRDTRKPSVRILNDKKQIRSDSLSLSFTANDENGIISRYCTIDSSEPLNASDGMILDISHLEEGEHTVIVRVEDPAGNTGSDIMDLNIDRTKPTFSDILPENGSITDEALIRISWRVTDENGIASLVLTHKGNTETMDTEEKEWEGIGDEDLNIIRLSASDPAGNTAVAIVNITVDTMPPFVEWISVPDWISSTGSVKLRWNASDGIGLRKQLLSIDGETTEIEADQGSHSVDMEEGLHQVILRVVDLTGRTAGINTSFIIDVTSPHVKMFHAEHIEGGKIRLKWDIVDNTTSVSNITVMLVGEMTSVHGNRREMILGPFEGDCVTVILEASDLAGNRYQTEINVTAEQVADEENEGTSLMWLLLLLIPISAVALGSILLFFINGRQKEKAHEGLIEYNDRK